MPLKLRPHDLLFVSSLPDKGKWPTWFIQDQLQTRPVVVRRAVHENSLIPVGIRGQGRSERYATMIDSKVINRVVSPEFIVKQQAWLNVQKNEIPHWVTLECLNSIIKQYGIEWGLCGSLAFELATEIPTANNNSDIDIRIIAPTPFDSFLFSIINEKINSLSIRVDCQIETPYGAFSLKEWYQSSSVLLKTNQGPLLTNDPWKLL